MAITAQVICVLSRELEDRPSNTAPPYRGHAVNHVVVGIGMPSADDLGVGLVWSGSERKDSERPGFVGHEETVSACDVFLSINPARVSVGPLSRIPMRLHEGAGVLTRPGDALAVFKGGDLNLRINWLQ